MTGAWVGVDPGSRRSAWDLLATAPDIRRQQLITTGRTR